MASNPFDAMIQNKLNARQERPPRQFNQQPPFESSRHQQFGPPPSFLGARPPNAFVGGPRRFDQAPSLPRAEQQQPMFPMSHTSRPPRPNFNNDAQFTKPPPSFQCRKCNSTFASKTALHNHLVTEQHFDTPEPSAAPPAVTGAPAVAMSPNHPFYQQARESHVIDQFQSLKQRMAARGPPRAAQLKPTSQKQLSANAPVFRSRVADTPVQSQSEVSADESDTETTSQMSFRSDWKSKQQNTFKTEMQTKPPSPSHMSTPFVGQPLARTTTIASEASLKSPSPTPTTPGHLSFNKHTPPFVTPPSAILSPQKAKKPEKTVVLATINDEEEISPKQRPRQTTRESPSIIADARGFVSSKFSSPSPVPSAPSPMPDDLTSSSDNDDDVPHIDGQLVGTCTDMCPLDEIKRRYEQNDIKDLEWPDDGDKSLAALRKTMIKQYQRSAADHNLSIPQHVRDPSTLLATMDYMQEHIFSRDVDGDASILEVYLFAWNRLRMVAKDFILQNYRFGGRVDEYCIECHERMVRYLIMMDHQLQENDEYMSMHSHQNFEQMNKALKSLNEFYDEVHARRASGGDVDFEILNEAEMRSYYVMLQLDNQGEVERYLQSIPDAVFAQEPMSFALAVVRARRSKNFATFFRLIRDANYLQACALFKYIGLMRIQSLRVLCKTLRAPRQDYLLPVSDIVRQLLFDSEEDAIDFLEKCDIEVTYDDDTAFVLMDGRDIYDSLPRDPKTNDPIVPATRQLYLIEAKSAGYTRGEVASGYVTDSVLWGHDDRDTGDIESSVSSSSSHNATPLHPIKIASPLTSPRLPAALAASPKIIGSPRISSSPRVQPSSPISKITPRSSSVSSPRAKPVNEFYVEDDEDEVSPAGAALTTTPAKKLADESISSPFVFSGDSTAKPAVETKKEDDKPIFSTPVLQVSSVPSVTPPLTFTFSSQQAKPASMSTPTFSFSAPPTPIAPVPTVAPPSPQTRFTDVPPVIASSEKLPVSTFSVQSPIAQPLSLPKPAAPSPTLYSHRHHNLLEKEGVLTSITLRRLMQSCYDRWSDFALTMKTFRHWVNFVRSRRDVQCDLENQLKSLNMQIVPREAHTRYCRPKYHRPVTSPVETISLLELLSIQLSQCTPVDASDAFLKITILDITGCIASLIASEQGLLEDDKCVYHVCVSVDDSQVTNSYAVIVVLPIFLTSQERLHILDRLPSSAPICVMLLACAPCSSWRYRWMEVSIDMQMCDLIETFADIKRSINEQQIRCMFLIEPSDEEEDADGLYQCLSVAAAPLLICSVAAPQLMRVHAMDWIESVLVRAVSDCDDVLSSLSRAISECLDILASSEELYLSFPHPIGELKYCRLVADYVYPVGHSQYRQCPINWGEDGTFAPVRALLESLRLPDSMGKCCDFVVAHNWDGAASLVTALRSARHAPDLATEVALSQRAWLRCIHSRSMQLKEKSVPICIPYVAEEDAPVPIPVPQVRRLEPKQRQEPPKKAKLFMLHNESGDASIPHSSPSNLALEASALLEDIASEGDMFSLLEECLGDVLHDGSRLNSR